MSDFNGNPTSIHGEPGCWNGTHIKFELVRPIDPKRKTLIWDIVAKDRTQLGQVRWFSRWRRYAFYPVEQTVYEETCLKEIASFINSRTQEHKDGLKD